MSPARKRSAEGSTAGMLEVSGGRLAYEVAGHGDPVVFIHSMIADRRMWNREFTALANDQRVVRFDLRGFGGSAPATAPFSYVRDLHALVSCLHLDHPFLVGCSMGGAFAIDYALAFPDAVSGLLLVASGVSGLSPADLAPDELELLRYDEKMSQETAEAWSQGDRSRAFDLLRRLWCSEL